MCTRKKHLSLQALLTLSLLTLIPGTGAVAASEMDKGVSNKDQKKMSRQVADEMVVTASRTEKRSIDVPVTTEIVTREDIELAGVTDLGDLISKHVTGHFHKYNGLLSPVGLRGFRTEAHGTDLAGHVLILIDGHRMGTGNAAKINLDRIERVEVIKGPASALYGSAAMGGVINLITKKGDGKLGGSIGAEYGSFDYLKGMVSAGGEVNEKFRFFASVSADTINDYDDPRFGTVYNTGVDKANIGGNFTYSINEQHEIRLGGNYASLTSETPSWLNWETYSGYDRATKKDNDKSIGYADLEYNGDYFGDALHWRALFYYLWDKNHWNWGAIDAKSDQTKYIDTTWGTDHQFTWKMNEWNTLLTGFLVETMEKKAWGMEEYQPSAPYTPGMDYDNHAVFIQDSLDLLDNRLNIIAAGRYDRFKVTTKPAESGSYADFHERSEDYSRFTPKIGVGVKFFDERLRLRANLGEGFKSPTADQLSADYVNNAGVRFLGNPNLDPETSLSYGFGVDVLLEAFTIKVDWYHTDYENKIVQESSEELEQKTTTYANHGDAVVSGLDTTLEWKLDQTFTLPFTASLWTNLAISLDNEDKETGQDMLYISDYEIKSGLDLGYGGLSAQLSHVLVGPQMITNYDTYQDEEKGSFDYWDLTIRYQFAKHWEIKGSVLNIFDQEVEWVRGHLMPERNYRIGLTYRF